ncbi:hypothetical protein AB0C65_35870 [Nocardia sp. NPDC048505]|uniref:hypothetical protein n=1 Tax=Nocardia sp. NPDC048505 TaxID=3155756 RepID=UPI0033D4191F
MTVESSEHLITSALTTHEARNMSCGRWEVSILPGRKVTREHARTLIGAADQLTALLEEMAPCAEELGLTSREVFGLIARVNCRTKRALSVAEPPRRRWWTAG